MTLVKVECVYYEVFVCVLKVTLLQESTEKLLPWDCDPNNA